MGSTEQLAVSVEEKRRVLRSRGQKERGVFSETWVCESFLGADTDWKVRAAQLRSSGAALCLRRRLCLRRYVKQADQRSRRYEGSIRR